MPLWVFLSILTTLLIVSYRIGWVNGYETADNKWKNWDLFRDL
jgi:hypothetical protein